MTPKFRVWDGDEMHEPPHGWVINCDGEVCFSTHNGPAPAEDFVALLYTGLTDAEGAGIYEGDILEHPIDELVVVRWERGSFELSVIGKSPRMRPIQILRCGRRGNCYENPELLEQNATPA